MQVKQQLELDMEQRIGSRLGKEYVKAVYCHLAYLTYMQSMHISRVCIYTECIYAEYIMWNTELDEAQAGIKVAGRNINNLRYADDAMPGRKWTGTKEPLDEGEKGEWKKNLA